MMQSLKSTNPRQYVLNYDEEENKDGITLMQLTQALWRVVKGKDKNVVIANAVKPQFLSNHGKGIWKFDPETGVVRPK